VPYKRRQPKGRTKYTPTIEALLCGAPVGRAAEVRTELLTLFYFGWSDPSVPPEAIPLAGEALAAWEEVSCP
jgi:hypothetical protein